MPLVHIIRQPRKIKDIERDLLKAGFTWKSAKGSHRKYIHQPSGIVVMISGHAGDDAKRYQEKDVAETLEAVKAWGR